MTNAMIILNESVRLMEEGVLEGTGQFIEVEDKDGVKEKLELPEEIHTFAAWKAKGYKVKKGEHAIATFPIWKYTNKTVKTEDGEEEKKENMFLKVSAFFKRSQVERMEKREA